VFNFLTKHKLKENPKVGWISQVEKDQEGPRRGRTKEKIRRGIESKKIKEKMFGT
jgi:hypothetical protein